MRNITFIILFTSFSILSQEFKVGADISFYKKIYDYYGEFYENGEKKDLFDILNDNGFNLIRQRIWHTPEEGYHNLSEAVLMAFRAKQRNMDFMLDFHYSDNWADPGKQWKPAYWENLDFDNLKDSIYTYTFNTLSFLKSMNLTPEYVQIGNEISCGFLWYDGNICGEYNTPEQWAKFTDLLKSAISAVKDVSEDIKIIIHTDKGGDNVSCNWFFDNVLSYNVEFDIIGLSYYPWWHGTLDDLKYNLDELSIKYNQEIMLTEVAYPYTLDGNDNLNNFVWNNNQLLPQYPASVENQELYFNELISYLKSKPKVKGLCYWEPAHISLPFFTSVWENLTLFDFEGNLLTSINAFKVSTTSVFNFHSTTNKFYVLEAFPNPFNNTTQILFSLPEAGKINLEVYDLLGRRTDYFTKSFNAGIQSYSFNFQDYSSGVYFYNITFNNTSFQGKLVYIR